MVRLGQAQIGVVQVVAHLVEERAQEGAKGDHLPPLRGAHPHRNERRRAPAAVLVQAVQFLAARGRPHRQHAHLHPRHAQAIERAVDERLCSRLGRAAIVGV